MAVYFYQVMREPEVVVSGRLAAESSSAAMRELFKRGYHVVSMKEVEQERETPWWRPRLFDRVRHRDVTLFTGQVSSLLRAGLPLSQALETLTQQVSNRRLQAATRRVLTSVEDGSALSAALSSEPDVFSPLYVAMVRAGESGGMLENVLKNLSVVMSREDDARARLRSMLTYPAILVVLGACTVTALLTFVIPRFVIMFKSLGQTLPLPTVMLIRTSRFFQSYWWAVLLGLLASALLLSRVWRSEKGRRLLDRHLLQLPAVGTLLMRLELARFARVVGELLHNGVTVLPALQIAGATLGSTTYRDAIEMCHGGVKEGESLSEQLKRTQRFPAMFTNIVAVAERSGNLDEALTQAAEDYESDVTRHLASLMTFLEPALIICVGAVVGFIVMAMLLPIFELNVIIQ